MKFEYSLAPAGGRVRTRVRVEGIVQGVGFRPFVHGLATRLDLAGFVGNDARGVFVEIEGHDGSVRGTIVSLELSRGESVVSLLCLRIFKKRRKRKRPATPGTGPAS